MGIPALVLLLAVNASSELGPPLRQDGYQLRPPRSFRMARMDLFHGTQAVTVARSPGASRYLSAALIDGDGEDAASLLISVIDEPFSLGPSARDELSTATVRHFADALDQPFQLERAEVTHGRVEVLGSIRAGGQLRRVLVAGWPGEARHLVVTASVPSGRWDALQPLLAESLDSLKLDSPVNAPPQRLLWAVVALLGALLMISVGLWRRRQSARSG